MKPNILLLFADDERFDTIAALGNQEIITPNLDELVARGTTFTQCHIPSGTSGAVCMPSRAMLNTGRQLFSLEGEGQSIPKDHALLGETLLNAGYDTFGTGKWHNGVESYNRSFNHGDEIFFGGMSDHWTVLCNHFDPTGAYPMRKHKVGNYLYERKKQTFIADHVGDKHSTEMVTDATINFIENEADKDVPFYAYTSFLAPHDPRTMPDRFKAMYNVEDISLPENFRSCHDIEYDNTTIRDEVLAPYPRTVADTKEQILEYYAMITHMDEEIGKIIESLKASGQYDNTIIIYTADNGLALGQHGLFGKQNHYEHSIRVPYIMAGPGIPENERRDTYIYLMDLFPTICDMVSIEKPKTVEGRSFWPCVGDGHQECRENLYFAYTDKIRSVKEDGFKLMEHVYEGVLTTQLFDVNLDPLEMSNLAMNPDYQDQVNRLRTLMANYRDDWHEEDHPMGAHYWQQYRALV